MLTKNAELLSNLLINISAYLIKDALPHTILVIYLEMNFSEKFNLNLEYILSKASDWDNQDNMLYKAFFIKFMDILQNDNLVTTESRDKLWGLVPKGPKSGWWKIKSDILLRLCLNE